MSEREIVLSRVRAAVGRRVAAPGEHPAPAVPGGTEVFAAALHAVGGELHGPLPGRELGAAVSRHARRLAASGRVVAEASAARRFESGLYEVAARDARPDSFAGVAVAIVAGEVGVAENGAVAVSGRSAPNRALLFLCEHLVLLLDASRVVPDLHTAFRALPGEALEASHLTWISGPSKTADIEQTLVLGAHGPRTLTVFLYRHPLEGGEAKPSGAD